MARTKATEVKDTEVMAEETAPKKTTARKTTTRKTAAKKAETEEVKAEEVKEEAPKKAPAKKTTTRKTTKKAEPETTVTIQFEGKEIVAAEVVEKAKAAFVQENPDVEIKTIDVYVKPEEGVAYYAVNGEGSGDYKVEL